MLHIEKFVLNPFQENTYIVHDETLEAVIIDCGAFFKEERLALTEYINANNLKPVHLIATHAHIDHNFGNNTICDEFGIAPEVCHKDQILMESLARQAQEFINYNLEYDMPPVKAYFSDGDTITFGNHSLKVINTPGHTPGSCLLYCEEEQLAFSGDTLFQMSIGRTDLTYGSFSDMQQSLKKIVDTLPHETTILPGHGPQTTLANEINQNPYFY